jgi:hypothetical protein
MSNKPTTLGYFAKRMKDSGYIVDRIFTEYASTDPRVWTVVIDPGRASVMCTCFVNKSELDDNYFEFYDGGQFLPNMKIKTQSIEVLIETLVKHGINNKSREYMNINPTPPVN